MPAAWLILDKNSAAEGIERSPPKEKTAMKKLLRTLFGCLCALCLCGGAFFAACTPNDTGSSGMPPSSGSTGSGSDSSGSDPSGSESDSSGGGTDEPDEPGDPALTAEDFLHTSGQTLVNARGEKTLLKGTNLGGWLHFEGWMDGGGGIEPNVWGNHQAVLDALGERFTDGEIEELLEIYQDAYIAESDLDYIASLGFNLVRIPFYWTEILDEDGNVKENAFDQLDWAVENCRERGIYVLLDLHGAPGGHTGGWVTGGFTDSNEFWTNETYQAWTVKLWQTVALRYKDEPAVCGYGLLNEPVPPDGAEHADNEREMYDMLYEAVRAVDEEHIVVMGAFYNFDQLGSPHVNDWQNGVYETHHYADADKSDENQNNFMASQIAYINEYKVKWNVPVLAGEFSFWSAENAWRSWLYTLSAMDVSWCNWTYKNTARDAALNWGLYHLPDVESVDYQNDDFDTIAAKWRGYATENYTRNEFLRAVMSDAALYGWDKIDGETISREQWEATAYTAGETGHALPHAFDGDLTTFYSNGEAQQSGAAQWIEIDLGGETALNRVDVFCPHTDYARGYELSALVGGEWVTLGSGTGYAGNLTMRFDKVQATQLRLALTADTAVWWRVYEIFAYLENEAPMPEN